MTHARRIAGVVAAVLLAATSFAPRVAFGQSTYYWDSNGATAGFGSTNGTWGASSFWSTSDAGTSATANTTITSNDDINFGTASAGYTGGRTVTVSGSQNVNDITFGSASDAVTLSGGTVALGGSTPTITVNSATATISSGISGSSGLTKTGAGLLILTASNAYTGKTLVSSGTLRFGNGYQNTWGVSLPTASNLEVNNAVVEAYYRLTRTLGTGTGQMQITGGRAGFTNLQADASSTFLTFTSATTVVTWGSAEFNPSTLVLNGAGAVCPLAMANPFSLNGATRTVEVAATGAGGGRGTYGVFERALTGAGGGLTKTGSGTLMLNGTNTYDGGSTIDGGGLWFNRLTAMPNTGAVTVNEGTILGVTVGTNGWTNGTSGNGTIGGLLAGLGGQAGGTVSYVGNVNLGLYLTANTTYSGDIGDVGTSLGIHVGNKDAGTATDPYTAASTLTLSGNNTYSGGTTLNRGTLAVGSANALSTGFLALNGGTIQSSDATARTIGNAVSIGGNVTVGGSANLTFSNTGTTALGATRTFSVASGVTAEFAQAFSGSNVGLTKGNTLGTLRLTGTSTYTGATTINDNSGTNHVLEVAVLADGGLPSSVGASSNAASNLTLKNATVLRYVGSANASTDRAIRIDTGTVDHGAVIESSGAGTLSFTGTTPNTYGTGNQARYLTFGGTNTGTNTYGKILANNGTTGTMTINKNGTGTWVLTGSNTYTGKTTVNAGTLRFGRVVSLYSGSVASWTETNINVKNGATLGLHVGGTGEFTTGNVTTLLTNLASSTSAVTGMNAGSRFAFDTTNAAGGSFTIADVIADSTGANGGARGVTKLGTGRLVLSNSNSYSGDTIVSAGTLAVTGYLSTGTVSVADAASLQGTGTIAGPVVVSGNLSSGSSPGILTVGSLSLLASSTTSIKIDDIGRGVGYDGITITGTSNPMTYGGRFSIAFGNASAYADNTAFDVFDSTGYSGAFDSVTSSGFYTGTWAAVGSGTFELVSGVQTLTFSSSTGDIVIVPEPATLALVGIGIAGLVTAARRRMNRRS